MSKSFSGVITALVTPFKDGALDLNSFRRLLKRQLDDGIQGFVVNGTTAESPTLTVDEVKTLFLVAKAEVAGQVPIIIGTGSNSTAATCEFTRLVCTLKPDGILVVVPYYNKPPQRGLVAHFKQVAAHSDVPLVLYNVPGRTVANMVPATVAELAQVDRIVGIKDATGDLKVLAELRAAVQPGFTLLSGDDGSCVDFCRQGGHGVIAVASQVIGQEMVTAVKRPHDLAESYRTKHADLLHWLYIESNPIPVKMALHWMGILDSPEMRLPLVALEQTHHKDFKKCLEKLGKL
jgi:4-hydroxy-tetrahydrodipicolinate synthase